MIAYMQKGGPIMWLLLLCSILAGALFLERTLYFHQISFRVSEFMGGLANLIRHQRWAEAQMECAAFPTPLTRVLHAAILRHRSSREELKAIVQEAGQLEVPRLERRLGMIAALGLLAPLLGLLGTVLGMIEVFGNMAAQSGFASSAEIANGMYQSLLTTAGGLLVAIPASLGYAYLSARINAILHELERAGIEVINLIVDSRETRQIIEFESPERPPQASSPE